jgi:hypothetical protein
MENNNLKGCPFCGAAINFIDTIADVFEPGRYTTMIVTICDCFQSPWTYSDAEPPHVIHLKAIEIWNNRV